MAKADDDGASGICGILGPILALLEPLLCHLNSGIQTGSADIDATLNNVGQALHSTTDIVGDTVAPLVKGVGGVVQAVPALADHLVRGHAKSNSGSH